VPNSDGQAYGLTAFSPIKPGHEDAIKSYLATIPNGAESPFKRVPATHTARWVVMDSLPDDRPGAAQRDELKSKYLFFDANFDIGEHGEQGLDKYLDAMAKTMKAEIDALYRHCVAFPGVKGFSEYIKRCQIETTFFFTDYSKDARGSAPNVCKALDVQQRFAQLAGKLQGASSKTVQSEIMALLEDVSVQDPPPRETEPPPLTTDFQERDIPSQTVQVKDVQGNVIRGYPFFRCRHHFFRVADAVAARRGLEALIEEVTHSGDWKKEPPPTALNVAFSHAGLRALGVPKRSLDGFPIAFQMGMKARAEILGDTRDSAPENWDAVWKDDVHVLVSVYAGRPDRAAKADADLAEQEARMEAALDGGLVSMGSQDSSVLPGDYRKEHFGYSDGFGQMVIGGTGFHGTRGDGKLNKSGDWVPLAAGELLYGYLDEAAELPEGPSPDVLARNGTFLVFRKLRQHVGRFRKYLEEHGARYTGGPELLAAKFVGRWRDGTPLALSPDKPNPKLANDDKKNNDFRYAEDQDGARCPLGAHIRRARPRDAMGFHGRLADRRRIMRRGLPYGAPLPEGAPDDGADRGILFLAFNIDIDRQFEFIQQQWLNYGNHFRQGNDKDILQGDHDGTGKAVIQAYGDDDPPYLCTGLPRFVDTRGGEYFFVPGIKGLRWIVER
jgi:Dyp-type peroxidase family